MTYSLLLALGLMFLAISFLITNHVGKVAAVVIAAVGFLLAAVIAVTATSGSAPW